MSASLSDQQPSKPSSPNLQAPAQPSYILRGHSTPVHSLLFLRGNTRLLSGDAHGYVVLWTLATKRPTVVWKAHGGTILGLGVWGDNIVTHGRDSRLCVWALSPDVEAHGRFSSQLPIENDLAVSSGEAFEETPKKQPWLLHVLTVSTLNFCRFDSCIRTAQGSRTQEDEQDHQDGSISPGGKSKDKDNLVHAKLSQTPPDEEVLEALIIAVPGANDAEISFYHLPSEKHVGLITAPDPKHGKAGMVMALRLLRFPQANNANTLDPADRSEADEERRLHVIAGYESGRTSVYVQSTFENTWAPLVSGGSSKHPRSTWHEIYTCTPHSQPILSLDVSSRLGCYFTSSADGLIVRHKIPDLGRTTEDSKPSPRSEPNQILQSKHSGQQGLCVRNDGKIMATAGWDKRLRVYSTGIGDSASPLSSQGPVPNNGANSTPCRPMRELAVCKWHRDGCYAAAFGDIAIDAGQYSEVSGEHGNATSTAGALAANSKEQSSAITSRKAREHRVRNTHWLAGGGKDGKISLWDMY